MKKFISVFVLASVFFLNFSFQARSEESFFSLGKEALKNLIADKENAIALAQAFEIYKNLVNKSPQNYELRLQGADVVYYLAQLVSDKAQKQAYLTSGIEWAKQAIALNPKGAGGHFFYGTLTGLYAEGGGILTGLSSKDVIKKEMEKVIEIDPTYEGGDAYLALGRWYMSVPSIMGGSDDQAKKLLAKAMEIAPYRVEPHLALAELYTKSLKYDLAKQELEWVLSQSMEKQNLFEAKRAKVTAKSLLQKIENKLSTPSRAYQSHHATPPAALDSSL
jgi:hypothetical protein